MEKVTWDYAKTIQPQGNGLLSKRKEVRSENWPAYYRTARGCECWTPEGTHYYDFNIMGVGCCILGYADPDVNQAVWTAIDTGNMCTLNCPEEVELTEKLLKLNPDMDMVRYSRMGGDAMAQAIRVARAHTGKEKILIKAGGYHGWHDWYMASGMNGQPAGGIPECLKEVVCIDGAMGTFAAMVVEPDQLPILLLKRLRSLCDEGGIPLIFDEITSGFRIASGGIYLKNGVVPDIVVYGKALGNGHPTYAIMGKRDIMEAYEKTFISSTMNTERSGFAAAIATLDKIERCKVIPHLIAKGAEVKEIWRATAEESNLPIEITEIDPLATFAFEGDDDLSKMTLYTQEMVKRGYLASSQFRASYAHKDNHMQDFEQAVQSVFYDMQKGEVTLEGQPAAGGVRK